MATGRGSGTSPSYSSFIGDIAAVQVYNTQLSTSAVEAEVNALHTTWFAQVPEPSTLVLLAAGLAGLLCYAWRKCR